MATWGENSSYQGAASGAATGAMVGGPMGALAGAGIGFVAGGILGGSQKDAAKRAEEDRQREIQRAIERQNKSEFNAKSQAEQWALADIGINKEDQVKDALANVKDLNANANKAYAALVDNAERQNASSYSGVDWKGKPIKNNIAKVANDRAAGLLHNMNVSDAAVKSNEGIISAYADDSAPKKY